MNPLLADLDFSEAWKDPKVIPTFYHRGPKAYQRTPIEHFLKALDISAPQLLSLGKKLPSGAYLAGGYLTSLLSGHQKPRDLDLYFNSEQALRETLELFTGPEPQGSQEMYGGYRLGTSVEFLTPKPDAPLVFVVRLYHDTKPMVELIKAFWYQDAEHVIDTFDFTVVQFALDGQELVYNPESLKHVQSRLLVVHREQLFNRELRWEKYLSKGYHT